MSDAVIDPARTNRRRRRRVLASTLAVSLTASLVSGLDAPLAVAAAPSQRPEIQPTKVIPHKDVPLARRGLPKSAGGGERGGRAWPKSGTAEVALAANTRRAGDLPVSVAS